MGREEYMRQLEYLLQDISDSEREEALQYYHDYFDDAGVSEEANVTAALGSPEKVAAMIKDGLGGTNDSAGEYTESGYQDERFREDNKVPQPRGKSREEKRHGSQWGGKGYQERQDYQERQGYQKHQDYQERQDYQGYQGRQKYAGQDYGGSGQTCGKDRARGGTGKVLLIILLCIFAIPIVIPIVGAGFGLFLGTCGILLGLAVTVVAGTFAGVIAGVAMIGVGIAQMFVSPPIGFLLTGLGLIALAIGLLMMLAAFWVIKKAIPALIRGVTGFIGKIIRGRGRS